MVKISLGSHFAVASMFVLALGAVPRLTTAGQFTVTLIDAPGAAETDILGINNTGQLVGHFFDQAGRVHGVIDTGGDFTIIDVPGSTGSTVNGINDAGQMVGVFATTTCDPQPPTSCPGAQSFFLDTGVFTTINFPGATDTVASGINNAGKIVGQFTDQSGTIHGFVLDADGFTQIDAPGATRTALAGINDAGQMVGGFLDSGMTFHGLLIDVDGGLTPIDYPGALDTVLGGINNLGQIDGAFLDAGNTPHAFLLADGNFAALDLPGEFTTLGGINDTGQIDGSLVDADRRVRGFLATPAPEPAPKCCW
jgi:probable HAF family extracellular repeat protein